MSKINLSLPEVQIREIRINSITGYQGDAKELVEAREFGLKDKERSFSQCLGCATSKAACMTVLIQDAAVISHGPVGCASCLHEFAFTYRVNYPLRGIERPTPRRIFSTNLKEKDTVYGGNIKLANTIREVYERTHANAIFVLTTCAAGIIGDDVESVCNEAEEELGIPVVAIFCEGFRSKVWTTGFDAAYHGIARKLIQKPRRRRDDMINVINFWGSDVFYEWFAPFGAKPNYIIPFSTVNGLKYASEAAATVQACSTLGSYLGAVLEQDFGVPEIPAAPPYGIAQTDRWFRALGKILGKEEIAEKIIAEKKKEYLPKIEALREKLAGKTAYVTAGAAHGHALLDVLGELGIKAVGAAIFHHDPIYDSGREENDQLAQRVADYGNVFNYNVCNKQEFELVNALNRLRPDVLLARHGGMTLWGAKLGIPSLLIGDEHYSMGYEGLVNYGERILEVIENDEFVKNLEKHAINPYTKWWLEQPPYYFLKGGTGK
ncbi:nitrogenase molybdenum-iron protein alpha chain [Acetivibrio thermocellus AD2]|jgi:nitrogenase molybdenum-iron protein alpha chain|uniref:Oxidoreductase/nitrogenase component 1 n=2 Tax=Acetivibrio thermocellus TaxID=1515 RepID=A3DFR2_ACET2|nr:nitrogenase component 1 [Acetivibrio thermocellus]NLG88933.1 nitrogenase [Clostridiaceae bacterium]ABN52791.1 oxidoreductase/nitrogenase component 1 [Acetivibrio thermocellus ATCC 27405]ADU75353.1 oxidoreductase/nitrogenase component 1 [Acetivibrio thermocellus DSM 1313]ALX09347.1 oxidoreductase/nitrogenase component 1 [Acetivibrio thermocellus AD2]ANV77101.1 oxidoreductase/nitrogenase component 1 [Acetivibrio thermocellus DSM 2360]